jgi:hypothetical protein
MTTESIIALVLCAVLGAPLTLVLHEATHALVYHLNGIGIEWFRPWPNKHDGRWRIGATMPARTLTNEEELPNKVAPLVKAGLLFTLWVGAWGITEAWAFAALAFWEATDWINWLQGLVRGRPNDGGRLRELMEE